MQSQNGKTKTAMLIELESIKDLLVEDDNIPTLQEVIVPHPTADLTKRIGSEEIQEVLLLEVTATPEEMALALQQASLQENIPTLETPKAYKPEQQQDFFDLTTLGDLPAPSSIPDQNQGIKAVPTFGSNKPSGASEIKPTNSSIKPTKPSSQNPFLPEHIRARLQGNNPPPSFVRENITRHNIRSSFGTNLNRAPSTKKASQHQQLINEIMDAMLPEIERELRERLENLSKTTLEEMLAEHK